MTLRIESDNTRDDLFRRSAVEITVTWSDGRQLRFPVGEDFIADTPTFALYLQQMIDALNGVTLNGVTS